MKRRRVKITGIGPVTPAGVGREAFWKGILEPVSRVRPFTKLDPEWGEFSAAYLEDSEINEQLAGFPPLKNAARHSLMAAVGARMALSDAGIKVESLRGRALAVVCGTAIMDFGSITKETESVFRRGLRGIVPRMLVMANVAQVPATVADALGLSAQGISIQSSCCSGLDAIGHAANMIASGEVDFAICGGAEAPLFKHPLLEFRAAGLTPATAERAGELDRPFDLWRTTGVISEGAAIFVLEPEDSPRPAYAWVRGYSFASDSENELCSGLSVAINKALAEGGVSPSDVEVISAWGPGHRSLDVAEVDAMSRIFRGQLPWISAYSIKGAIGNPLAAAPAIQVAAAALGLGGGVVPPTVNFRAKDPSCVLNLSPTSRCVPHRFVLLNAHGVAGTNAAMVLERGDR